MSRPKGSPKDLENRRRRALAMLRDGATQQEVADRFGVGQPAVSKWLKLYTEGGEAALDARPTPGRPSALSDRQKSQLSRWLLKRPTQLGFATDLWTLPRIRELIGERFGVWYHRDHLSRLIRDLGFSWQKPVKRAAERDEPAIEQWVLRDWPRIKKKRSDATPTSSSSTNQASR